ncbi:MAG TPA: hypothetical protein VK066_09735 [Chloroflexota bacterium]|nr:hypothetical protein [Chloroflexota bacterium]
MAALWPVFGLLVLTIEWVVLRRVTARLTGRSTGARVVIGAGAGLGLSAAVALLGLLVAIVSTALGISGNAVAAAAASTMFVTGLVFIPIAAAFGAILLAVESYRVPSAE